MNIAVLIGELNNSDEIKMFKNLEVLEFKVNGVKAKAFGKLANEIKSMKGKVVATGEITLRDYTNKDGKTYPIQDIAINKIESLMQVSEKEEAKTLINNWDNPKDIVIPEDELPFY